ncbi:MAG: hypothetical protein K0M67_21480 [Thiobacillus sp.]|nr:hypothetical protein [Thiobacillus sp.]
MTINTTHQKKAAGGLQPTAATTINDLDCPTAERADKVFSTLRAAYALAGHTLHRSDPKDGDVTYWAERWGQLRFLPTIDSVRQFLEQIGGRL